MEGMFLHTTWNVTRSFTAQSDRRYKKVGVMCSSGVMYMLFVEVPGESRCVMRI